MNVAEMTSGAQLADTTVVQLLAARLAERPEKIALQQKRHGAWTAMTWSAYAQRVVNLASALRRAGLERGDRVAIMGDSSEEWLIADMATMCAGGVMVGVYFTSSPEEVAYCFTDSGAKFAFVGGEPQLLIVLASGRAEQLRGIIVLDPDWTGEASASIKSLAGFVGAHDVDAHDYLQKESATAKASDVVSIGYTSGTTGNPKGAMLTHLSILAGVHCITLFGPSMREEEHRVVVHLPMSHTVARGQATTLPLIADAVPYFGETTADFAQTIKEVKPTYYMAPPRFYQRFATQILSKVHPAGEGGDQNYTLAMTIARRALEDRQRGHEDAFVSKLFAACREQVFLPLLAEVGFDELKVAFTSSAAMPSELMSLWQLWGLQLRECYGQTELVGANLVQMAEWPKAGNVGVPLPDPAWETAVLQDGEMIVRGPGLFAGYWNKPDETKAALRDGWLYTGDIVEVSPEGTFKLVDRKKEIINTSNGKSISPTQIENELRHSPFISEAAVIGEGRKYLTALIEVDATATMDWAKSRDDKIASYADLAGSEIVNRLIEAEIGKANGRLARAEQIKAFRILPEELSLENGVMTPTRKKRRKQINERYQSLIASLYDETEEELIKAEMGL
ncbi:AMP-dependent synthetase/ligase [Bradyrhizobium arachidis]|uniref:Long-chain fatty acid--CoA ligase n=1 Tax=Bradyrhizobium arachidis TaxID=858423 RepID=A0AAE7NVK9_9BRAD|nr:AMP-binding protein [Bradyrhizobium arachidis]QOZ72552.1 long-chain fatty acid--CoA ligase [Bradyrhizobium arachidis]SFU90618.1 long-chain acyl-CoA synthetase [Bradyrhizobium arachidis]